MSAALTENDLFGALRGYASTLEVQYMIEEEVRRFQEKVLPRLLAEAMSTTPTSASAPPPPSRTGAVAAGSAPDSEWVQTFLQAHVDDVLGRRLPGMIAEEVQRQLRRADAGAPPESNADAAPAVSPPREEAAAPAAGGRARAGLPPLPPSPPRPPLRDTVAAGAERGPAKHQRDEALPAALSSAQEEGRRQRERILSAIADVEHQVNGMQRDLNEAMHQQRLSRCRLEYLCESLQNSGADAAGLATPPPLFNALEQALDDRQADQVRAHLASAVQCLLRAPAEARGDGVADAAERPVAHAGAAPQLSARSPTRLRHDAPSSALATAVRDTTTTTAVVQRAAPAPSSTGTSGLPRSSPVSPPSPPPTAPSSTPTARTLTYAHHTVTTATRTAATTATTTSGTTGGVATSAAAVAQPPAKSVRSITTRGAAAAVAAKAASPPPSASPPAESLPSASITASAGAPPPPPALRQRSREPQDDAAAVAPVTRPAPTPRDCVDPRTRERARHGAGGAQPTNGTPRTVVLGIDAVNVPSGVLPGALGRQGAVRVQAVAPHQLADRAGVCRGDVLLVVNQHPVGSCEQLRDVLAAVPPAQSLVAVDLYRHTAHQILSVTLEL
ncbi:hypothetical protein NESM_000567400 [Novymonas esmeraldas]|uniref:PDZ domain-containing protein n=1 Tax=Novymonas esmeraldas TaxID=1808958 RepID=A0AAW0EQK9_9TRYP